MPGGSGSIPAPGPASNQRPCEEGVLCRCAAEARPMRVQWAPCRGWGPARGSRECFFVLFDFLYTYEILSLEIVRKWFFFLTKMAVTHKTEPACFLVTFDLHPRVLFLSLLEQNSRLISYQTLCLYAKMIFLWNKLSFRKIGWKLMILYTFFRL